MAVVIVIILTNNYATIIDSVDFDTEEEAHSVYCAAANKYAGEFARKE